MSILYNHQQALDERGAADLLLNARGFTQHALLTACKQPGLYRTLGLPLPDDTLRLKAEWFSKTNIPNKAWVSERTGRPLFDSLTNGVMEVHKMGRGTATDIVRNVTSTRLRKPPSAKVAKLDLDLDTLVSYLHDDEATQVWTSATDVFEQRAMLKSPGALAMWRLSTETDVVYPCHRRGFGHGDGLAVQRAFASPEFCATVETTRLAPLRDEVRVLEGRHNALLAKLEDIKAAAPAIMTTLGASIAAFLAMDDQARMMFARVSTLACSGKFGPSSCHPHAAGTNKKRPLNCVVCSPSATRASWLPWPPAAPRWEASSRRSPTPPSPSSTRERGAGPPRRGSWPLNPQTHLLSPVHRRCHALCRRFAAAHAAALQGAHILVEQPQDGAPRGVLQLLLPIPAPPAAPPAARSFLLFVAPWAVTEACLRRVGTRTLDVVLDLDETLIRRGPMGFFEASSLPTTLEGEPLQWELHLPCAHGAPEGPSWTADLPPPGPHCERRALVAWGRPGGGVSLHDLMVRAGWSRTRALLADGARFTVYVASLGTAVYVARCVRCVLDPEGALFQVRRPLRPALRRCTRLSAGSGNVRLAHAPPRPAPPRPAPPRPAPPRPARAPPAPRPRPAPPPPPLCAGRGGRAAHHKLLQPEHAQVPGSAGGCGVWPAHRVRPPAAGPARDGLRLACGRRVR
jgi:hypothetical protein